MVMVTSYLLAQGQQIDIEVAEPEFDRLNWSGFSALAIDICCTTLLLTQAAKLSDEQ